MEKGCGPIDILLDKSVASRSKLKNRFPKFFRETNVVVTKQEFSWPILINIVELFFFQKRQHLNLFIVLSINQKNWIIN